MLPGDMRVFEEDGTLTMTFEYTVGYLRVTAKGAALEAVNPFLIARPATAPCQFVQALAGGTGTDALAETRKHVEMFGDEGQHLWLAGVVGDQGQGLVAEIVQVVGAGVGG